MKNFRKIVSVIAVLVLLAAVCGVQAAAEDAQTVNILLLVGEGSGSSYYLIQPMLLTLNLANNSIRLINFYYQTQIYAATRDGDTLSMPMNFLAYCEPAEIVKAYENTYGIAVDRYVIYLYNGYSGPGEAFDILCPLVLDIPEEWMGDAEYTSFNGNMKSISKSMNMAYTPVTEPGPQEIGPVGLVAYYATIPDRIWESGDRFTMMLEDYKYWDAKNRAVIEALTPNIAQMDRDAVLAVWELMTGGQETDITQDDIAAWSQIAFNFPADADAYLIVPGFEGVEMLDFDANALTGVYGYQAVMLAYDNEAMAQTIQTFINGE